MKNKNKKEKKHKVIKNEYLKVGMESKERLKSERALSPRQSLEIHRNQITSNIKFPKTVSDAKQLNLILIIATLSITIFGMLMIYSASWYSAKHDFDDSFYYVKRQLVGTGLGVVCAFALSFFNYSKLKKFWIVGLVVAIVLLILVFVPGIGVTNFGATRWIKLFGGFTIQPSEIAKFAFILFCATFMSKFENFHRKFLGLIPVLFVGIVFGVLIMLEPNLSITICIMLLMFTMLFVGGMRVKHFLFLIVPALLLIPVLILLEPYRMNRFMAFLDPWASPLGEGFQLVQSLYALGSGGFFGVGLFNSRQKFDFLPFSESDFIFSVIGEELGFFGSILIIVLYLTVVICGIKTAINARDRFGCYLATGIVAIIAIQVVLNIAVVTGSMPPTGLPLPMISYGNTAQLVFLSSIGVLCSINNQRYKLA